MTERLVEKQDRWVLPLAGRTVVRCLIDCSFGLLLDGEPDVTVSLSNFRYQDSHGNDHVLDAEADRRLLAPALALLGLAVQSAYALKSGRLQIHFADGSRIQAGPGEQFESWQVSGPGNILIVSPAGGDEPAVWDGRPGVVLRFDDLE